MPELLEAKPTIQNGQVTSWELCHRVQPKDDCGAGSASHPFPTVNLGHNANGTPVEFQIKINDSSSLGVVFAKNVSDPAPGNIGGLWIQAETDGKPSHYVIAPTSQIPELNIHGYGSKQLTFMDKNKDDAVNLLYRLNFIDKDGHALKAIDPEIKNGGTNAPPPPPPPPTVPPGKSSTAAPGGGALGHIAGVDAAGLLIGLIIGLITGFILCRLSK